MIPCAYLLPQITYIRYVYMFRKRIDDGRRQHQWRQTLIYSAYILHSKESKNQIPLLGCVTWKWINICKYIRSNKFGREQFMNARGEASQAWACMRSRLLRGGTKSQHICLNAGYVNTQWAHVITGVNWKKYAIINVRRSEGHTRVYPSFKSSLYNKKLTLSHSLREMSKLRDS